ncbi:MAG: precorrin-8X methylmutase [Gammaproteobacteria bacterium]|nr:MAG: precorrin-8X methylmutase [Gammaproteobacteria bacterium]
MILDDYIKDPHKIEEKSFAMIRAATDLSGFDEFEQQLVMRLVHTSGNPDIAGQVRISAAAIDAGIAALNRNATVLCDVEMVKQGLTKRYLNAEPMCFLNHEKTAELARASGETRSMSALELWTPYLQDSIVIIGNAPTALFRLLEMLETGPVKPSLVIGMPVGFVGAPESKDYLWDHRVDLGVECFTLRGRVGGSALAAGAFNTLVRLKNGLLF